MKIDEGCINHNATRLIKEVTSDMYEWIFDKDGDTVGMKQELLGEIHGILLMADAMKEVLKG